MWIIPIILITAGIGTVIAIAATVGEDTSDKTDRDVPNNEPDQAPPPVPVPGEALPDHTQWKLVDKLLGKLKDIAGATGIPLGLLVAWVGWESGGRIADAPKPLKGEPDSERGLFQLSPSESKALGLDHKRLSTDVDYSIMGGVRLIGRCMKTVDALKVAQPGSSYYWLLVKMVHTVGGGALKGLVEAARAVGAAGSWSDLEQWAIANAADATKALKGHSPTKWFGFMDKFRTSALPFGLGTSNTATTLVGGAFDDIVDPLDCLKRG